MKIYVVTSNCFKNGVFGIYSSIKRARIAFENYLAAANKNIVIALEYSDGYSYKFITKTGETFDVKIYVDILDAEFEAKICKED